MRNNVNSVIAFLFIFSAAGCAVNTIYDPLGNATRQTLILNKSSLANVSLGMTVEEVHAIMGETIVIGYAYKDNSAATAPVDTSILKDQKPNVSQDEPVTIDNPYRIEEKQDYAVEFYITSIVHPDGQITDDELFPLIFHKNKLVGKGWDYYNRIKPRLSDAI